MKTHDLQLLQYCHDMMRLLLDRVAACTCEPKPHPGSIERITNEALKPLTKLLTELKEEQDEAELESILPCPLCLSEPDFTQLARGNWQARCLTYRCFNAYCSSYHDISTDVGNTKEEAIEAWNKLVSQTFNRNCIKYLGTTGQSMG